MQGTGGKLWASYKCQMTHTIIFTESETIDKNSHRRARAATRETYGTRDGYP